MGHTHFSQNSSTPPEKRPLANAAQSPAKRQKLENGQSKGQKAADATRAAKAAALANTRANLPIAKGKERIVEALKDKDVIVVLGETGSGKTTQVPQFLYEADCPCQTPRIAITQPRRVAAISLATRVAEEQGCALGDTVGYTIRFDDKSTEKTRIKYLTDGTLLQEMISDRLLSKYDVVIVDEAHERTLRSDMILGFLKKIQKERNSPEAQTKPDEPPTKLKVIVMSATLDAARFSAFFDNADVLYVWGRQYKVALKYTDSPQDDYYEAALKTIFQLHLRDPPGDILVFLTGEDEIESLAADIDKYAATLPPKKRITVSKLYAKLPPSVQAEAFEQAKPDHRKIVLSTNIAETSITIPGIRYVIDTGVMKEKAYNSMASMETLMVKPISQSAARQRMGRAGRDNLGTCYRLYEERSYRAFEKTQKPEILRCNLEYALLVLKAAGQDDLNAFDYMDRPPDDDLRAGVLKLIALGALSDVGALTDEGEIMARLPLDPTASRILLSSFQLGCPTEVTSLLALLDHADKIFSVPASQRDAVGMARERFVHREGDHLTLLRLLAYYEQLRKESDDKAVREWLKEVHLNGRTMRNILDARKQLRDRCEREGLDWRVSAAGDEDSMAEKVLRSCASGLAGNAALLRDDGKYKSTISSLDVKIHPSSVLGGKKPGVIIYSELTLTSAVYARTVSSIRPEWLQEHSGKLFARHRL